MKRSYPTHPLTATRHQVITSGGYSSDKNAIVVQVDLLAQFYALVCCPGCGGPLALHGMVEHSVIMGAGLLGVPILVIFMVSQVYCRRCVLEHALAQRYFRVLVPEMGHVAYSRHHSSEYSAFFKGKGTTSFDGMELGYQRKLREKGMRFIKALAALLPPLSYFSGVLRLKLKTFKFNSRSNLPRAMQTLEGFYDGAAYAQGMDLVAEALRIPKRLPPEALAKAPSKGTFLNVFCSRLSKKILIL